MWQPVLAVYLWWDGPREGVTRFGGLLRLFSCEFDPDAEDYAETFQLYPLPEDLAEPVVEQWAIWRRGETAFRAGEQTAAMHPALPHERGRYDALGAIIQAAISAAKLEAPLRVAARLRGDFWRCEGAEAEWVLIPNLAAPGSA
ncbi:MAG: hypothetical protein ACOYM5_03355 [Caulobacter sp.]